MYWYYIKGKRNISGCCSVVSRLQISYYVMNGIKFEFNDIIKSLYTKYDSEQRRIISLGYFMLYILIIFLLLQKKKKKIGRYK